MSSWRLFFLFYSFTSSSLSSVCRLLHLPHFLTINQQWEQWTHSTWELTLNSSSSNCFFPFCPMKLFFISFDERFRLGQCTSCFDSSNGLLLIAFLYLYFVLLHHFKSRYTSFSHWRVYLIFLLVPVNFKLWSSDVRMKETMSLSILSFLSN